MRSPIQRFGLAVSSVALAQLLTLVLPPIREGASFLLLLAAVVAATWYGGRWPGLLATALAGFSSVWFLQPGSGPLKLGPDDWVRLGVFLFVTLAIICLVGERGRAAKALSRSRDDLEKRVAERNGQLLQANEALRAGALVRERAEEALSQLATIEACMEDGVVTTALDGTVVSCNPGAERLYGYTAAEFVGRSISLLLPPDASSQLPRLLERISHGEAIGQLESVHRRRDGTQVQLLLTISPIKNAAGSVHGVSALVHDITRRKEAEKKIALYQQQLRSLASALSFAEQQERRRIATELHDHLAQMLILSKMKISMLQTASASASEDVRKAMEAIHLLLDKSIEYTRTLICDLCPPMLHEIGLEAALEWLAKQTEEQHGIRVHFEDDEQPKPSDESVRILLFQAVRELLMNVIKHAKASQAIVAVRRLEDQVEIRVEDDGTGFDMESVGVRVGPERGFGLFSIRERLDVVRGSFEIRSSPGGGSRATLRAPLRQGAGRARRK
ncbi:MAG TPA: PAS domain S-box protein [Candidatus Krumholzibacteria bacterium]|nr:PAS domain S-box protein [Candidatus Krumholzibacteria bacterium]